MACTIRPLVGLPASPAVHPLPTHTVAAEHTLTALCYFIFSSKKPPQPLQPEMCAPPFASGDELPARGAAPARPLHARRRPRRRPRLAPQRRSHGLLGSQALLRRCSLARRAHLAVAPDAPCAEYAAQPQHHRRRRRRRRRRRGWLLRGSKRGGRAAGARPAGRVHQRGRAAQGCVRGRVGTTFHHVA
jgi:hypothetical protein